MVKIIIIYPGGKYSEIDTKIKNINKVTRDNLPNKLRKFLGTGDLSSECDFTIGDDKVVSIFAFEDGVAGKENKFDLPPPIDTQIYFGCVVAACHIKEKLINFTKKDFDIFYEKAFGGFEDLKAEDTWSEEEEENSDDRDFIVGEDEEIEQEESDEESEEYIDSCESDESEEDDVYITETKDDTQVNATSSLN